MSETATLGRLRLVEPEPAELASGVELGTSTPEGTCGWDGGLLDGGTFECGLPAGHPGTEHWMVPKR